MADYRPSSQLAAALDAWTKADEAEKKMRKLLRDAIAAELTKYPDLSNEVVAGAMPWSEETIRGIAREYEVPRKRKPTVRSIKPLKRG